MDASAARYSASACPPSVSCNRCTRARTFAHPSRSAASVAAPPSTASRRARCSSSHFLRSCGQAHACASRTRNVHARTATPTGTHSALHIDHARVPNASRAPTPALAPSPPRGSAAALRGPCGGTGGSGNAPPPPHVASALAPRRACDLLVGALQRARDGRAALPQLPRLALRSPLWRIRICTHAHARMHIDIPPRPPSPRCERPRGQALSRAPRASPAPRQGRHGRHLSPPSRPPRRARPCRAGCAAHTHTQTHTRSKGGRRRRPRSSGPRLRAHASPARASAASSMARCSAASRSSANDRASTCGRRRVGSRLPTTHALPAAPAAGAGTPPALAGEAAPRHAHPHTSPRAPR